MRKTIFGLVVIGLLLSGCDGFSGNSDSGRPDAGEDAADAGDRETPADAEPVEPGDDGGSADDAGYGDDDGNEGGDDGRDDGRDDVWTGEVLPEDTVLVRPVVAGPVLGAITGYEMNSPCPWSPDRCELPLYSPYDRDTPEWWDILVDELLLSRVHVVMAHGRGCFDPAQGDAGAGNMCPRLLRHLVEAIERAGAGEAIRLGMWDDTGAYPFSRNQVDGLPDGTRFDLADPTSWRFFWDHNMKIWFDTVPSHLWYRLNGRPVVAFWSLADAFFTNQQGRASALLSDLRSRFLAAYGEDPLFIVDITWIQEDSSITPAEAQGVNSWFTPPGNHYTYTDYAGQSWGALVPGFRDPDNLPGCGDPCREVPRRNGDALRSALNAGSAAAFILLEGWTDIAESAGFYRSDAWSYPNQYINIVREYADPAPATLRFQAEAADLFVDLSAGNLGGAYRAGDLDVGGLAAGGGWFVGWTDAGEWIEFSRVTLGCGVYRFTGRLAAPSAGQRVRLEVGGVSPGSVEVPSTAGWEEFTLVHLGALSLAAGTYDLRLVFETGAVNLDWLFLRRAATECP
jgi:hypothetical protein